MSASPAPPLGLIAELTHKCPLQCAYCANPLALVGPDRELTSEQWEKVIDEAAAIGVLQFHFSGGEPMARKDLARLVARASAKGLYTNLITSGVLLSDAALAELLEAGIDHIQVSFQDATDGPANAMGGYKDGHRRKLEAAARIRAAGLPLTANFVVHQRNIASLPAMLALAEDMGADRIEIAHVQYYGWALENRGALLPTRDRLETATLIVEEARTRLLGRIAIDYVVPDYYAERPKACMGGWGNRFVHVTPEGRALPCHAAETIPGMAFSSVAETTLTEIWNTDPAFARFRGTDWMPDPCRSCDRREIDWGGCRCQALALTGDAANVDPACAKAPGHGLLGEIVRQPLDADAVLLPRRMKGSVPA